MPATGRRAFTLVELLVVISIIGILVALLLPAVHRTREAGRRVKCQNNLKQLGIAVTTYQTVHTVYPAAGIVDYDPNGNIWTGSFQPRKGKMFSWVVLILPQLEQMPVYSKFDFTRTVLDQPANPQAIPLEPMICPSDASGSARYFHDTRLTEGKRFAKGNYAAYCSPFHTDLTNVFPGALSGHRRQKRAHIRDGLTHTILISEVRARAHPQDQRGAWALPWTGSSLLAFDMHQRIGQDGLFQIEPRSLGVTQPPNNEGPNQDMLYLCPDEKGAQLDGTPCFVYSEGGGVNHYLSAAPRSQHPRGVNVVFMGGRMAFLPNDVDEIAMAYMISINDGHNVDSSEHVR